MKNKKGGKNMDINQVQKKVNNQFPTDNLVVIDYKTMKEPMTVKCNFCHKIFSVKRAENFFRRKIGCNDCHDTKEWIIQKQKFLEWLKNHKEFELIDDLNLIHNSQSHIKCKCTLCGRIQEGKNVYDYYANKKCYCQSKGVKKPVDQLKKDFKDICIFLEEYKNTDTPILLKSLSCGHEFKSAPKDMLRRPYLCPICNSSHGEKKILIWLENNHFCYYRQYKIENFKVDFFLPDKNIIIEFNGLQHYQPVAHFGGQEKFIQQKERDNFIRKYCQINLINLIEISYMEYDKIEEILEERVKLC